MVETTRKYLPTMRVVIFGVKPYPAIAAKIDQGKKRLRAEVTFGLGHALEHPRRHA